MGGQRLQRHLDHRIAVDALAEQGKRAADPKQPRQQDKPGQRKHQGSAAPRGPVLEGVIVGHIGNRHGVL